MSKTLRTTPVSALFRQFGSCFFNYKTLQNKHNIRKLSGNIKIVRNSFSEGVSERLLFYANSAIFQLYHGENKLICNEMMTRSALF
jgi:hypothetical protein